MDGWALSVGKPRPRWKDVVRKDTTEILGIREWRRREEGREEWRRLRRETWAPEGAVALQMDGWALSVGKPRPRWKGVVRGDTTEILGIREWRRRAEGREELRRLLKETRAPEGAVALQMDGWALLKIYEFITIYHLATLLKFRSRNDLLKGA